MDSRTWEIPPALVISLKRHEKEWDHSLAVDECRKNLAQTLADGCFPLADAG